MVYSVSFVYYSEPFHFASLTWIEGLINMYAWWLQFKLCMFQEIWVFSMYISFFIDDENWKDDVRIYSKGIGSSYEHKKMQ